MQDPAAEARAVHQRARRATGAEPARAKEATAAAGRTPGCELTEGAPIDASCGIFVDASAAVDGDGTRASPRRSIAAALDQAEAGDTVYVCDAASGHTEAVTPSKSLTLVGGLSCATWVYAAAGRTAWTAAADAIPLRITGASTDARVEGFTIDSADAQGVGGSSIAMMVAEATVEVARSTLTAGDGAAGLDATQPAPAAAAQAGFGGTAGCESNGVIGGGQNTRQGSSRNGGLGGSGTPDVAFGGNANPGSPLGNGGDAAGQGEGFATCNTGGNGGDGTAGPTAGLPGGSTIEDGLLTASGYLPASGLPGQTPGTPGAGGGGGGGANQRLPPLDGMDAGPSGGGGGAGGCGGTVGNGGGGGGASFALASIDGAVTLSAVVLQAGTGGIGGQGAPGQVGQPGGSGGVPGGPDACSGGRGGNGAQGGSGGGGRGGHAAPIAYVGTAPDTTDGVTFAPGIAGAGGPGGVGTDAGNTGGNGAVGEAADMLELPAG